MPTIRQLAKIAGVSIATVSRALNDQPRVNEETSRRIKELAARYQYRPNNLMQSLITGKSRSIGCVITRVDSAFYSTVLAGALEAAFAESYHVITLQTDGIATNTRLALETLMEQRVDGIILTTLFPLPTDLIHELRSHQIATVLVDNSQALVPIDHVRTDEIRLAELCVEYLMGLGHRIISYTAQGISFPSFRTAAMTEVFRRNGLDTRYWIESEENLNADSIFTQFFRFSPRPTAIITTNDGLAAELLQYALLNKIQIPRDISIMGCGNLERTEFLYPALTTIEQEAVEVGHTAIALVLRRIHEGLTNESETITITPRLIERESCCRPAHVY